MYAYQQEHVYVCVPAGTCVCMRTSRNMCMYVYLGNTCIHMYLCPVSVNIQSRGNCLRFQILKPRPQARHLSLVDRPHR
jgi:hypothetical protein